jgi:hypothetical protein
MLSLICRDVLEVLSQLGSLTERVSKLEAKNELRIEKANPSDGVIVSAGPSQVTPVIDVSRSKWEEVARNALAKYKAIATRESDIRSVADLEKYIEGIPSVSYHQAAYERDARVEDYYMNALAGVCHVLSLSLGGDLWPTDFRDRASVAIRATEAACKKIVDLEKELSQSLRYSEIKSVFDDLSGTTTNPAGPLYLITEKIQDKHRKFLRKNPRQENDNPF